MSGTQNKPGRPDWTKPEIKPAGSLSEILKGGGGKTSIVATDTGDARKPKGQG